LKKNKALKGSITVEASFVVGLALMVIFTVLSLCFYIHNQAWYSSAASETAITAATYAVRKNGEYHEIIESKIRSFEGQVGFPDNRPTFFSNGGGEQMRIGLNGKVPILMSNQSFEIDVDISSKVIKPVKFIRQIQSLKMIKETIDAG